MLTIKVIFFIAAFSILTLVFSLGLISLLKGIKAKYKKK